MGDPKRGVYGKFDIKRVDGSSESGGKHHGCSYFVLDLDHDAHAIAALLAYADSCEAEYPLLAKDLREVIGTEPENTRSAGEASMLPQTPADAMRRMLRTADKGDK